MERCLAPMKNPKAIMVSGEIGASVEWGYTYPDKCIFKVKPQIIDSGRLWPWSILIRINVFSDKNHK